MSDRLTKKYVVLEHLLLPDRGFRFWTLNTNEFNSEWYKAVGYTDDSEEAIKMCENINYPVVPTINEIEDFLKINTKSLRNNETLNYY